MEANAAGGRANANNCPVNIKKIYYTPTEGQNSAPISLGFSRLKGNLAFPSTNDANGSSSHLWYFGGASVLI